MLKLVKKLWKSLEKARALVYNKDRNHLSGVKNE